MLQTDVGGRVQLRKVQGLLAGSDKQLQTALAKNTREAVAPIKREIPAEAQVRMPTRYGTVLAKAVKVSARVTAGTTIKAVVKIAAKGKKEPRDIKALDKGVLRHPLFGNRKHWYADAVRAGFVSDPIEWTRKRVVKGAQDAADQVANTIAKG